MADAVAQQAQAEEQRRPLQVRPQTAADLLQSIAAAVVRDSKLQHLADVANNGGEVKLNNEEMKTVLQAGTASAGFYHDMWKDGMVNCNTEGGAVFTLTIPANIKEIASQANQSTQMAM